MCFDHFILLGHPPRGESQTLSLRLFLLFFFSLLLGFFYDELEGRGCGEPARTWTRTRCEHMLRRSLGA